VEVAEFGVSKENWFKSFLELPNGIPAHDTFGRVFRLLDPQQWQAGFLSWVETIVQSVKGQIVPIDGKALRRSHDKTLGHKAIHMVSAWAAESRVVLGQVKVDKKSNEITAIPTLLEMLTLSGCIVTIDAMGCQKKIARKIIEKGADYALALKKNQNGLYEGVRNLFAKTQPPDFEPHHYHKTAQKSHGRQEVRQCWTRDTNRRPDQSGTAARQQDYN
jgi:predicted transposase YbfD/YdcC